MSNDWLCIDDDSPELDAYIAENVADAVAQAGRFLDEGTEPRTEAQRQAFLAKVANLVETEFRKAIDHCRQHKLRLVSSDAPTTH